MRAKGSTSQIGSIETFAHNLDVGNGITWSQQNTGTVYILETV